MNQNKLQQLFVDDPQILELLKRREQTKALKGMDAEHYKELAAQYESQLFVEILKNIKGEDGTDYVLTPQDKEEIASMIEVPIVEKIIEKTEVIKEQPITRITNEIKEVAVGDTPEVLVEKLNTIKSKLDASVLANLPEVDKDLIFDYVVKNLKKKKLLDTSFIKGLEGFSMDGINYKFQEMMHGGYNNAVVALADVATPALDASIANTFTLSATQNPTIAVPQNPTDGQKLTIRFSAVGGARTLSLNAASGGFSFGTDITGLTATLSGTTDWIGSIYNGKDKFWNVVAYVKGY